MSSTSGAGAADATGSEYVLEVRPNDVLFGRGSGPNDHEGNIKFRELVAERKEEYMATNHRQTKAKIAKAIVDRVFDANGRFLKKLEGNEVTKLGYGQGQDVYQIVGDDTIMEKAKQALRQNRNRDDHHGSGSGGGRTSPKPSHVTMASASPIFQQTLQQYGNNDIASLATNTATGGVGVGGYARVGGNHDPLSYQQQQQYQPQPQPSMNNPMSIPSSSVAGGGVGNMYQQQQHQYFQQQQQQFGPERPIYSLDHDGYATYTKTLDDPEDQPYFYNSSGNNNTNNNPASGGGPGRTTVGFSTGNNNNNMAYATNTNTNTMGRSNNANNTTTTNGMMMMMQSTGNSRRGSALLGGRKSDLTSGSGGNRRGSLQMDEVWKRDSMGMGMQAQSMQMSELMESFRGMSTTGELNSSTDTIGTIDNFSGSLAGQGMSAYNMSGISNISTMSMGSLFKTAPDTPSSDGKSGSASGSGSAGGGGGSKGSSSMDRTSDGSAATNNSRQAAAASASAPTAALTPNLSNISSTADQSLGGSDLWTSKQLNSLLQGPLDSSANLGGGVGTPSSTNGPSGPSSRMSKQINNLMQAPMENSSNLNMSESLFGGPSSATGPRNSLSDNPIPEQQEQQQQQQQQQAAAYPGQILPPGGSS